MISVCMATYNGEKYLKEQIDSILTQLSDNDELIISDDGSTDNTLKIIARINDSRIVLLQNQHKHGPVGNFENALKRAKGDYIFLSDQDDVWIPGKVASSIETLSRNNVECVVSNRVLIDETGAGNDIPVNNCEFTKFPFLKVLSHNPYIGCCMAFTKAHLNLALPFPQSIPMHDLWIGLLAHKQKKVRYLDKPLIKYRRHANNVTTGKSPYSIYYRVSYRIRLLIDIIKRLNRI